MPTAPTPIDAGPAVPNSSDPESTFDAMFEAFLTWQKDDLQPQANALATNVYNNAVEAATSATTATTQAGTATTQATAAIAAATSAITAPGTQATSTTSLTIGTGAKALTIQTGKAFSVGQYVNIASTLSPISDLMSGRISSHDSATGALGVLVDAILGSGTIANWTISLGSPGANLVSKMPRIARTSNTALTINELGKLIDVTSGTFTQTTDLAATLGTDWFAYLTNTGTGVVTFGSLALVQGAMVRLHSDGTTVRVYPERLPEQTLSVRDEKTSGTAGGTPSSSGTWITRTLNTFSGNTIVGSSIASNEVTLPAGTYHIEASAPAWRADNHRIRVYNVTGAAVIAIGTSETAINDPSLSPQSRSFLSETFTLASSSAIRMEHFLQTATATSGLGKAVSTGAIEIYARAFIRRLA